MTEVPLFPLRSVLLPAGRMGLQIFEPRYLQLISQCLKENSGFGVVWIRHGSEVLADDDSSEPQLAQLGTYAEIVDWNSLPNGLLGITIAGTRRFRLLSSRLNASHQYMGEIEWLEDEPYLPLPDPAEQLLPLLKQLMAHPHVAKLNFDAEIHDVSTLSCVLAQLLPIEESIKFALLAAVDPTTRLEQLVALLDEFSR